MLLDRAKGFGEEYLKFGRFLVRFGLCVEGFGALVSCSWSISSFSFLLIFLHVNFPPKTNFNLPI